MAEAAVRGSSVRGEKAFNALRSAAQRSVDAIRDFRVAIKGRPLRGSGIRSLNVALRRFWIFIPVSGGAVFRRSSSPVREPKNECVHLP